MSEDPVPYADPGLIAEVPEPLRVRAFGLPAPGEADPWQDWLDAKEALAKDILRVRPRILIPAVLRAWASHLLLGWSQQ